MTKEDFETTDGEGSDLLSELLELVDWSEVQYDKEKEKELAWFLFDKILVEPGLRFVLNQEFEDLTTIP